MAGWTDPTFAQRAQAAPSPLDALEEGLSGTPLDAARREVASESLDELAHRLFIHGGKPPLSVAQAEQELEQKRQRMGKIQPGLASLRDGGAAHWKAIARFECYIALLRQKEQQQQQMAAEKERHRQERQRRMQQQQQQQEQQQAPPQDQHPQQQEAGGSDWLQRAMHNSEEAEQERQQQRQEQRTKGFVPKPVPPDSKYNGSQYGYGNDSADYRNNAPPANRGAPAQQNKRHQQLLGLSGGRGGGRGGGRSGGRGSGAQPKKLSPQGLPAQPTLGQKCKLCFEAPPSGSQLKHGQFKDNGERVLVCFKCLQENTADLIPVVSRQGQQTTLDGVAVRQQASRQAQHGKPQVQGLTSQTGLTAKPQASFYQGGKPALALHPSTAGGAAAGAATGRGPMRGKGKQQQQRRTGEDSDGDYVPDWAAGQDSGKEDSLLGPSLPRARRPTRRGKQQADAEPVCIDLLSDDDGGGSGSPSGDDPGAAAAAEPPATAAGPAAAAGRRRPPRAAAYMPTSDRFQGLKCLYPPGGGPGAVEVTHLDLPRLDAEEFLNDTIIDFYVRWLQDKLPPEVRERCYFFNTFFFKKLTEKEGGKVTPEVEALIKEKGLSGNMERALLNHQKVKKWTKDVDLFSKDFIFVPVHEALHWSLMVVCHPGELMPAKGKGAKSPNVRRLAPGQKTPCILHLDSLSGSHNAKSVANTLRLYLRFEWLFKSRSGPDDSVPRRWAAANPKKERSWLPDDFQYKPVTLPKQDNHCDCGLFVCSFIEFFTFRLPPAICTADLDQLKNTYSRDVRDLFESRPEGYYPGMLTEHWFPAGNPSKLRWFIRLKVVELMAEQNGYLAAPGTEQEQWLEGPDPEMRQRLQVEIEQLRGMVSDNGYLSPEVYLPMGEEAKQRRKAAAQRQKQQEEQTSQDQKTGRQARQAAAAKRRDDAYQYDSDQGRPNPEQLAAAAEARLAGGAGGSQQAQQAQQQHFISSALQQVAQQGDSGEQYESDGFEPEQLPTGPQRRQQGWDRQPDAGFEVNLDEDEGADAQHLPGVDLQPSPDFGGTDEFPSSAREIVAGVLEQREVAHLRERRRKRPARPAGDDSEEEGAGAAEQQQQQGHDQEAPAAAGQQQEQGAPKRQRQQPEPEQPPSSSTGDADDEDDELEIVGQHPPPQQYQQPPQQHQQPPQPASGVPPEPPQRLDWGRVVEVAAELREVDGPPDQPPHQQQRVELRFWYRDQGTDHQLAMRFDGSSTEESVMALYRWRHKHQSQLYSSAHPIRVDLRAAEAWMQQHQEELEHHPLPSEGGGRARAASPPLLRNPAWQPSAPERGGSGGQGNGGAVAGKGRAEGRVHAALRAEGTWDAVEPLVAAAEDPLAQQQSQQEEEEGSYADATEDSQPLPATQEWSGGGPGWHDADSGEVSPQDAAVLAAAPAAAPAAGAAAGGGPVVGEVQLVQQQLDGMHIHAQAQQAQQAVMERPWRQRDKPGGPRRAAQLLEGKVEQQEHNSALQRAQQAAAAAAAAGQAAGAGLEEVDLTRDEVESALAHQQEQQAQHANQQWQQWQQQEQEVQSWQQDPHWQQQLRHQQQQMQQMREHFQQQGVLPIPHQQPAAHQTGGAKRGVQPAEQPLAGQDQALQGSKRRRKGQPSHGSTGLRWAEDSNAGPGGEELQLPAPAAQPAAEGQQERSGQTAKERRQHRQQPRQPAGQPGDVASAAFNAALYADPVHGAAAAAAAVAATGAAGGHFANPQQLAQQQQGQPQVMVPRPPSSPRTNSWAVARMAQAGSAQATAALGRPGSAAGGSGGSAGGGGLELGQPAQVDQRYSAAGMQHAKQPLQQQNATFANAATFLVAEAETAAQRSLEEKQAAAPAGIDSSQMRAASQAMFDSRARAAAQRKSQEQSMRRQARAAAVAVAPPAVRGPVSPLVDLTGDAD